MQARYCTEKCQGEDWANHKDFCRRRQKKRRQKRKEKSKKKKESVEEDNKEDKEEDTMEDTKEDNKEDTKDDKDNGDGLEGEEDGAFVGCNEEGEEQEEKERCCAKIRELNLV